MTTETKQWTKRQARSNGTVQIIRPDGQTVAHVYSEDDCGKAIDANAIADIMITALNANDERRR